MFQKPLAFLRLQKTQMRPEAASTSTPGSRSGSGPVVNCLAAPHVLPSKRLNQIFHAPLRRELQNSQSRLLLSTKTPGSHSSMLPAAAGGATPNPNLLAALEPVTSMLTSAPSPAPFEASTKRPPCALAAPAITVLMAAATSVALAAEILAKSPPWNVVARGTSPLRSTTNWSPSASAKGSATEPVSCEPSASAPLAMTDAMPSVVATAEDVICSLLPAPACWDSMTTLPSTTRTFT